MDDLHEDYTPFDYITKLMPDKTVAERRARLGASGFGSTLADSPCANLSGGEKARLLFLLATFNGPHVLILDEPTNHLDMDSREALIHAINDYEGAVILIAHDRHIIETCADRLLLVDNGTITTFEGDLEEYTDLVLSKRTSGSNRKPQQSAAKPKAKPLHVVQKMVEQTNIKIMKLQGKLGILDQALADHTLYTQDPRKAADFVKLRAKIAADLATEEERWLELNMESEDA
jgi:ATP-binding cassette, subfamily F, member 3